jgi:hypothetical protein
MHNNKKINNHNNKKFNFEKIIFNEKKVLKEINNKPYKKLSIPLLNFLIQLVA